MHAALLGEAHRAIEKNYPNAVTIIALAITCRRRRDG